MTLSELLKKTRQYFWSHHFAEVEINYLNSSLPLEPNLYSFKTKNYYLPTSPELALKKHLAHFKNNCFAVGHCFRDLESTGPHHSPEFLMLEWYEINKNLSDLQKSLEKYLSLFLKLKIKNFKLPADMPANEPDFNQYFLNEIEPTLPPDSAGFISGYPAFLSPLAEQEYDEGDNFSVGADPRVRPTLSIAQRFELYINGVEIANACTENRNAESIKSAFAAEQKFRQLPPLPPPPISAGFIAGCGNLPPCGGIGLGLERLLMVINHQPNL